MTCTPSASSARPLSTFRNGTTLLDVPEVVGRAAALDLAVHRVLEQDRAEDAVAVEGRAGDDAGAHRVHEVEHLVVAGVGGLVDAVELERLRRAAAALVERGDEALAVGRPSPTAAGPWCATDPLRGVLSHRQADPGPRITTAPRSLPAPRAGPCRPPRQGRSGRRWWRRPRCGSGWRRPRKKRRRTLPTTRISSPAGDLLGGRCTRPRHGDGLGGAPLGRTVTSRARTSSPEGSRRSSAGRLSRPTSTDRLVPGAGTMVVDMGASDDAASGRRRGRSLTVGLGE